MILRGGGNSAGGRRRGRGGQGRGGRSKGRSLSVASTIFLQKNHQRLFWTSSSILHSLTYLILHKHGSEAVKELEWRDDVTLNED